VNNSGRNLTLINIPELSSANDKFVELANYREAQWVRLSGVPRNMLERVIKRPKLSRYRGAFEAAMAARHADRPVIISHMPRMSASVNRICRLVSPQAKHIAFSFNFTDLPAASDRDYLVNSFRGIDRFIVYSEYEREVYAKYFGIPIERIRRVFWTQDAPPVELTQRRVFDQPYLCAIGGEGRDFHCLVEAARISRLPIAIVARPHSLLGLKLPDNVKVFSNLPLAETWGIAANSQGVVVPLLQPTTCCGQITIVSTMMLGLPLIASACHALDEYLGGDSVALTYRFGDPQDLANTMGQLLSGADEYGSRARMLVPLNRARYARQKWTECIESCLDEFQD